jgi:hypothetical protein
MPLSEHEQAQPLRAPGHGTADFDFALALTCLESAAVLFGQHVGAMPAGIQCSPDLALRTLQGAAFSHNPRIRTGARCALTAYFGVDVDQHPELLTARAHGPARPECPAQPGVSRDRRAS